MVGWHHRLNGYEFEQAAGVGDGQESLVCYSPGGHKELDTTELLNCGVGKDSRVPWTAWTSNQSILKEISPDYSLEGLMLKL